MRGRSAVHRKKDRETPFPGRTCLAIRPRTHSSPSTSRFRAPQLREGREDHADRCQGSQGRPSSWQLPAPACGGHESAVFYIPAEGHSMRRMMTATVSRHARGDRSGCAATTPQGTLVGRTSKRSPMTEMEGRNTGRPRRTKRAADYVAAQFKKSGLEPAGVGRLHSAGRLQDPPRSTSRKSEPGTREERQRARRWWLGGGRETSASGVDSRGGRRRAASSSSATA